jgi:hypothetical protein
VIIGLDFQSPRVKALENWGHANAAELPQLQRVSDIMMAFWLRDNPNPKNLKYYLVYNIKNELTVSLINTVLRNHNLDQVPYWPGIVANMWEEEGPTLLGKWSQCLLSFDHELEGTVALIRCIQYAQDCSDYNANTVQDLHWMAHSPSYLPNIRRNWALSMSLRL